MCYLSSNMRRIFLLILSLVLVPLFCGCGGKKTAVELGNEQQILHKGNGPEPEDLDPHIVEGLPEHRILLSLFEGLVNYDPVDSHPVPGVAKSWDISKDGRLYTFHLRDDAKWSNGDPVTAEDFVFAFQRMLSRNLGAPYADRFYAFTGGEDYHKGVIDDFSKVGVKALDDHTLQLELVKPLPYFLSMLTFMSWYPVHKDTILKHGKIDQRGTGWTRAGNLVSNGPFRLKNWKIGTGIVVEKDPNYWDAKNVKLKEIHFHSLENHNTEERAFRTGGIHLTETLPLPKVASYKDTPYLFSAPYFSVYTYGFNTQKPPFDDERVRQAMSLALDRKSIVENVTKRGEDPAFSFVPPGAAGYVTTAKLEENVERAKELLAEAGYPNGEGFPKVTLLYNTSDSHRSVAEAMQHMWAKNLNVHVELVNQEWKVFLKERSSISNNLYRLGWVGEYLDPNTFLEIFTSDSGNNTSGWKNAEYDNYILEANSTLNQKKRFEYFDKAENLLMKELPVLPIYFYVTTYLVQPAVKGWYPNLLDLHPYNRVYLDASGLETKVE